MGIEDRQGKRDVEPNTSRPSENQKVYLVGGLTYQMPDTSENQAAYPQHTAQKPGLGFPIARVTGLISLATGATINMALGKYKGKGTGETSLFKHQARHTDFRKGTRLGKGDHCIS